MPQEIFNSMIYKMAGLRWIVPPAKFQERKSRE